MTSPRTVAVIPARMSSSRFPGKPLKLILDRTMLEHVYIRTSFSKVVAQTIIATCDSEIERAAQEFGASVVMTSDSHERCTERVAEAIQNIPCDIVVLVQGDEPLLDPQMIEEVAKPLIQDASIPCCNLMTRLDPKKSDWQSSNIVKTVYALDNTALYMSREPIPTGKRNVFGPIAKQLGIMAFRKDCLVHYTKLSPTPLEKVESIDMLRLIENRIPVLMKYVEKDSLGVDTPEDLERASIQMKTDPIYRRYTQAPLRK